MEELKRLVCELEKAAGEKEQIGILQKIGEKLINEYEICVGELTIKPMLVEAFYYHEKKFPDISVHASNPSGAHTYTLARKRQKNHFGELYIHYGCKDGIDIVLSKGDYYLSFLVKNAWINEEWKTQCAISSRICEYCKNHEKCQKGQVCQYYGDIVLKHVKSLQQKIVFCQRKGLPDTNYFAYEKLAALPIDMLRDEKCAFTPGQSKTKIIEGYIKDQLNENGGPSDEELSKLKKLASGLIAWENFEEK